MRHRHEIKSHDPDSQRIALSERRQASTQPCNPSMASSNCTVEAAHWEPELKKAQVRSQVQSSSNRVGAPVPASYPTREDIEVINPLDPA